MLFCLLYVVPMLHISYFIDGKWKLQLDCMNGHRSVSFLGVHIMWLMNRFLTRLCHKSLCLRMCETNRRLLRPACACTHSYQSIAARLKICYLASPRAPSGDCRVGCVEDTCQKIHFYALQKLFTAMKWNMTAISAFTLIYGKKAIAFHNLGLSNCLACKKSTTAG